MKRWIIVLAIYVTLFLIYVYFFGIKVQPADWMQIMLLTALVGVTIFYAWQTQKQAEASAETVKRMKEQTVMVSRPVIILKDVAKPRGLMGISESKNPMLSTKYFSHFIIINVGNGPAVELEMSLLDNNKNLLYGHRETYLRPGEEVEFVDLALAKRQESTYYVVCEYRLVFSAKPERTWEQTWLPFKLSKASKAGEIYVGPGELEFHEVTDKDRIATFRSKPA